MNHVPWNSVATILYHLADRISEMEQKLGDELRTGNQLMDKVSWLERDLRDMTAERDHYLHELNRLGSARPALSSSDARDLHPIRPEGGAAVSGPNELMANGRDPYVRIAELEAEVDRLTTEVAASSMADAADAYDAGYAAAGKDVETLRGRIDDLERAKSTLENHLRIEIDNAAGWKRRAEHVESRLSEAKARVKALEAAD